MASQFTAHLFCTEASAKAFSAVSEDRGGCGCQGWPLPTTHTWEDAPGYHGHKKRNPLAVGDGKFKHIATGCYCKLPLHFWAGVEKRGGSVCPHPELNSSILSLRSVVVGLLLPISQSAALSQVGSAVSLLDRILSP